MASARRILIVEDEPNTRLVFRTALSNPALPMSVAEDGEKPLERYPRTISPVRRSLVVPWITLALGALLFALFYGLIAACDRL
jgi:CheY-like chemotaxis protein